MVLQTTRGSTESAHRDDLECLLSRKHGIRDGDTVESEGTWAAYTQAIQPRQEIGCLRLLQALRPKMLRPPGA